MDYDTIASDTVIAETIKNLNEHGFEGLVVANGAEALAKIKEMIPAGASVMNGASTTLQQIGYVDYLKEGKHGWNNLHENILGETDKVKQAILRKQSVISDYYLGSVHALSQTGEFVVASFSGSQLPHIAFTSQNVILVVSAQKITPTLAEAVKRLETHVVPLEDARMKAAYGIGTMLSKMLTYHAEGKMSGRKITLIIVKEKLGF